MSGNLFFSASTRAADSLKPINSRMLLLDQPVATFQVMHFILNTKNNQQKMIRKKNQEYPPRISLIIYLIKHQEYNQENQVEFNHIYIISILFTITA